jgi:hypothetical protein
VLQCVLRSLIYVFGYKWYQELGLIRKCSVQLQLSVTILHRSYGHISAFMNVGSRILAGLWAGVPKTAPSPHKQKSLFSFTRPSSRDSSVSVAFPLYWTHHWAVTQKPYNWDGAYANGFPFQMRTNGNTFFGMGGLNWLRAFCGCNSRWLALSWRILRPEEEVTSVTLPWQRRDAGPAPYLNYTSAFVLSLRKIRKFSVSVANKGQVLFLLSKGYLD